MRLLYSQIKANSIPALILALAFYGVSFGQGQHTHDSQAQGDDSSRQERNGAPSRPMSSLIRDADNGIRMIQRAVRDRNTESLARAVDSYLSVLDEVTDAMRLGDPYNKNLTKDIARVEKISRANLQALRNLRKTAPADFHERLEDAVAATGDTYDRATSLREEIYSEGDDPHDGHNGHGCMHGSHGGHDSGGLESGEHHGGWFSPASFWGAVGQSARRLVPPGN